MFGGASRQMAETVAYVDRTFDAAVDLVQRRMGERVGRNVELQVSNSRDLHRLVVAAHRPMFGRQVAQSSDPHQGCPPFGKTTISASGVLIVINAQLCRGRRKEIGKTLLHELGHAVQFQRPGARDRLLRGLANNYGIHELSDAEAAHLNTLVDQEEDEAARLEHLWTQLDKATR